MTSSESANRSLSTRLHGLRARLRRFASRYGWLAKEGVRGQLHRVAIITAAGFGGASAQATAIAIIFVFVRAMASEVKGDDPHPGGVAGWVREHIGHGFRALLVVGVVGLVLWIFSAVAVYISAVQSRKLGRRLHERAAEDVFRRMPRLQVAKLLPGRSADLQIPRERSDVRQLVMRSARLMGNALESIMHIIPPSVHFVVFLAALLALDPVATLLCAPVLLIPLPLIHRLNARIRREANLFYGDTIRDMGRAVNEGLKHLDAGNTADRRIGEAARDRFREDETVREYLRVHDEMQLASNRSVLITSTFRPVLIVYILLILGYQAIHDPTPTGWAMVVPYIIALRQFLQSVEQLATQFSVLNRFYPQVAIYADFVAVTGAGALGDSSVHESADGEPDPKHDAARARPIRIRAGDGARIDIQPGEPAMLIGVPKLGRLSLPSILHPLRLAMPREDRDAFDEAPILFVNRQQEAVGATVGAIITAAPGDSIPENDARERERAQRLVNDLGLADDVAALENGLETLVTADVWESLPARMRLALRVLPAAALAAPIVVIDAAIIEKADEDHARRLLALLDDRIVILPGEDPAFNGPVAEHVLVVEEGRIIAAGDGEWWRQSEEASAIRGRLKVALAETFAGSAEELDDDMM